MNKNKKAPYNMDLQLFADGETTKVENMIDPEVMADMISAKLPTALRFAPLADIDNTLKGRPGTTLTVPKFEYIGDAEDVAEGEKIPYSKLTTTSSEFTIKKAGKGVKITDEAVLSGLGDPLGEAENQLLLSIANKIDNDTLEALQNNTKFKFNTDFWNEDTVSDSMDLFDDEDDTDKALIMNNLDASVLRKAVGDNWERASDLGDEIILKGTYGRILGAQVSRSKKLKRGEAYLVKPGALKIFTKRDAQGEKGRDIDYKLTKVNIDQHYGTYLYDEGKAVKITVKTPTKTGKEDKVSKVEVVNQVTGE